MDVAWKSKPSFSKALESSLVFMNEILYLVKDLLINAILNMREWKEYNCYELRSLSFSIWQKDRIPNK